MVSRYATGPVRMALWRGVWRPRPHPIRHTVVASVLIHNGNLCLLRRSANVRSEVGMWHCVTGFLEDNFAPRSQALAEIAEETGITDVGTESISAPVRVVWPSARTGPWVAYCFLVATQTREVQLNWENDAVTWVRPSGISRLLCVQWLPDVLRAVGIREYEAPRAEPPQTYRPPDSVNAETVPEGDQPWSD